LDTAETENNLELNKEGEPRSLKSMAKVHDFLEMWQGTQNQCATQKEPHTQKKQMSTIGYISDTKEIIKAF